jgi:hypothetical protein
MPGNKLYVNIGGCHSTIYDASGAPVAWVANSVSGAVIQSTLGIAGRAVFRDMGKTIYTSPTGSASVSSVLRKVQLIANAPTGTGTSGDADGFYTGYIQLGGVTYGGGAGGIATNNIVRLN